jgi:hypothetical protein
LLAVGFGAVFSLFVLWIQLIADQMGRSDDTYRYVVVRVDGVPLVQEYSHHAYRYLYLDGQKAPGELGNVSMARGGRLAGPEIFDNLQRSWAGRILILSDQRRPPIYWYLVHDGEQAGRGYLVGFDSEAKFRVGYIGTLGFRSSEPPREEQFPVPRASMQFLASSRPLDPRYLPIVSVVGNGDETSIFWPWSYYLVSGDRLEAIDLRDRSVRTLLEEPGLLSSTVCTQAVAKLPDKHTKPVEMPQSFLVARAADRVLLLSASGTVRSTSVIPIELRGSTFTYYELADGSGLAVKDRYHLREVVAELYWFDRQGTISRREEVARGGKIAAITRPGLGGWLRAVAFPSPVAAIFAVPGPDATDYLLSGDAGSVGQAVARALAETWPPLLVAGILAAGLAWLTVRRQREYAQGRTVAWAIFVFLFGLPGLVGYLVHRRWPVRAACPACHRLVPRDRSSCAACSAEFPTPQPKGIEVLVSSS